MRVNWLHLWDADLTIRLWLGSGDFASVFYWMEMCKKLKVADFTFVWLIADCVLNRMIAVLFGKWLRLCVWYWFWMLRPGLVNLVSMFGYFSFVQLNGAKLQMASRLRWFCREFIGESEYHIGVVVIYIFLCEKLIWMAGPFVVVAPWRLWVDLFICESNMREIADRISIVMIVSSIQRRIRISYWRCCDWHFPAWKVDLNQLSSDCVRPAQHYPLTLKVVTGTKLNLISI